ncbi:hypothetical protein D7V86_16775 [bacterium D16-51]|nr:hypothetical protein D7V96_19645 [bacterium D16-59]RKI57903.1 hypothetical protein D7V86_16775 [bacterium D16-51]
MANNLIHVSLSSHPADQEKLLETFQEMQILYTESILSCLTENRLQSSGNVINKAEYQQNGEIGSILPNRQLSEAEAEQVLHYMKEKIWKEK